jgi:regulation of enolase protein 1 (concanavalin A-like superfamily)
MTWFNPPAQENYNAGQLTMRSKGRTDYWRKTFYGYITDNGHFLNLRVSGDFTFQARVDGNYAALYDQAGLMVRLDEQNWMKCGSELVEGKRWASVVFTRDFSDWSTVPALPAPDPLRLRLSRHGSAVRVEAAAAGGDQRYAMLRLAYLPAGDALVGPMCCSPERAGFEARFWDFRIGEPIARDLHG